MQKQGTKTLHIRQRANSDFISRLNEKEKIKTFSMKPNLIKGKKDIYNLRKKIPISNGNLINEID
jgi:hypothetical protein